MILHSRLWFCLFLLISCSINACTWAAALYDWRSRTIYQVLTDRFAHSDGSTTAECNVVDGLYCGGSWTGIENKLDYIQNMNFDAIWISPVVAQLTESTADGEAYTAYWAQDLYALNSNFGTQDDLKNLISAVHQRGMYLMLDVVVNHLGSAGKGENADYTKFNPFNDEKFFHPYCPVDSDTNQTNVEQCWLGDDIVALADLRTEDKEVRDMFGQWISQLVSNYSIDGLRIDTTINVEPDFFPGFVEAAGVFATGETMDGDNMFVCRWASKIGSLLNYPIYYPLTRAFASTDGSINDLVDTMHTMKTNCLDPTAFGSFSENHDVDRFASFTEDTSQAKNIIAYTILADGIPIIYQGQEQHMKGVTNPYTNRAPLWQTKYDTKAELYSHVADLIKARKHFIRSSPNYTTYSTDVIYSDYHSFAMRKGVNGAQVVTVLNNNGVHADDFELCIEGHDLPPGTTVTEIMTCKDIEVNGTGCLTVPMGQGKPKVLYPRDLLKDSGLCGNAEPPASAVPTAYSTVIGGHTTIIETLAPTVTEDFPSSFTPSHTRLPLGAASRTGASIIGILLTLVASVVFASSGCALAGW